MRNGVGDPRWRVSFGNLEQRSGLVREPLCERNIGFALLCPSRELGSLAEFRRVSPRSLRFEPI
jgi:hypothetical protein